jgi:Calcineurin-like phosphoesterase
MFRPLSLTFLALALVVLTPAGSAAAPRIVAMGDLHGDLGATRQALRLAGAIDESDHWIGGDLVVVQTGDQLDRGDQEQAILELLDRLQDEAQEAGGAVHILNGNHELMNVRLDLRYVTEGGFTDFQDAVVIAEEDSLLLAHEPSERARVAAFRPGGPYARRLAERPVILIIDGNVFVHGGVLPLHLDYGIKRLNDEVRDWMLGQGEPPAFIHTKHSPTWSRSYSDEVEADDCRQLKEVLERLGAERMIVGHTVQENGIAPFCEGKVWCIDFGLSDYYGSNIEVLEISGDLIRVLR